MATDLLLRPPRLDDEAAVRAAHEELREDGFEFALWLDHAPSFAAWIDRMARYSRGAVDDSMHVRTDFLLADVDGEVVGRTSIRYALNDRLRQNGGHVGYGVRPAHRRRGHAREILRQSLARLFDEGIRHALVTCDDDNHASAAVIEHAGGVLRDRVAFEGRPVRRYDVPTAPTAAAGSAGPGPR